MANVDLSTLGNVIKAAYEGEANTNAFTDAEQSKLARPYMVINDLGLVET